MAENPLLTEYAPRCSLVVDEHPVTRARFRAIDAHNHLGRWLSEDGDWVVKDVDAMLRALDECNIAAIVNLDGMWGDELEANLDRFDRAHPGRIFTFAQAEWSLVTAPDFGEKLARQLEDSMVRGAHGLKVWKHLGLRYRDGAGRLIPIDDERIDPLWETAGRLGAPVVIHIADPVAFFQPLDRFNERWEQLHNHPDWHFYGPQYPPFEALIDQFEGLISRHPGTTFVGVHVGCYAENLKWVSRMLDTYPNFYIDIAERIAELGRQPYSSRRLFERHPDRILFGVDLFPPSARSYAPYFRFLETADEYFPYGATEVPNQGRWGIYGLDLPDDVLRKVYVENATRLLIPS